MKTKWTSTIISWVLVLIFGTGVPSVYGQKVTLEVWNQKNDPLPKKAMASIINIFEKENPNVSIAHRILPNIQGDELVRIAFG